MGYELEETFAVWADRIAISADAEMIFSCETLPQPPPELHTHNLIVKKGRHFYHSYTVARVDTLSFRTDKRTFQLLGLLFLSKVFHPIPDEVHLHLTHSASDIREIVLDFQQTDNGVAFIAGYQTQPVRYIHRHEGFERFRWTDRQLPTQLLPLFNLTNKDNIIGVTDEEWNGRDIVRCAGSDHGNILFANLLLNASHPEEERNEFALESECGFGGVGTGSAEVNLVLHGNQGWDEEL